MKMTFTKDMLSQIIETKTGQSPELPLGSDTVTRKIPTQLPVTQETKDLDENAEKAQKGLIAFMIL